MRKYYVYILSNASRSTIYIGVTNDIVRRQKEHKESVNGFANRYKCFNLVYYEIFNNPAQAISREKEIKKWRRSKKDELIQSRNPDLLDLLPDFYS